MVAVFGVLRSRTRGRKALPTLQLYLNGDMCEFGCSLPPGCIPRTEAPLAVRTAEAALLAGWGGFPLDAQTGTAVTYRHWHPEGEIQCLVGCWGAGCPQETSIMSVWAPI